jgi:hypothetical protein
VSPREWNLLHGGGSWRRGGVHWIWSKGPWKDGPAQHLVPPRGEKRSSIPSRSVALSGVYERSLAPARVRPRRCGPHSGLRRLSSHRAGQREWSECCGIAGWTRWCGGSRLARLGRGDSRSVLSIAVYRWSSCEITWQNLNFSLLIPVKKNRPSPWSSHTAGRSAQNGGNRTATLDTFAGGELSAAFMLRRGHQCGMSNPVAWRDNNIKL